MRLLELVAENYGIFANHRWDFGSGRFQLICGPNEAGKSTLLQLVRETLFGFPHSSPYHFAGAKEMAATARLQLASGQTAQFRRRKGRKDVVRGQSGDGQPLDERRLQQLLGGASQQLFQSVFAFSLDELAAGQHSLEDVRLTEALFGGAIGGLTRFKRLRERIESETSELFTPRATKRPINHLLARAEELAEQLREAAAPPAKFAELKHTQARQQQEIARLRDTLNRLRESHQQAQRLCEAWRPFQLLQQLKQQSAGQSVLRWTAEQFEQAAQLQQQLNVLEDRRRHFDQAQQQRQQRRQHLEANADNEVLSHRSQIQSLQQDQARIQGVLQQLPVRQREREQCLEQVLQRLRDLDLHWAPSRLAELPDDPQLEQRLLRVAAELGDAQHQLRQAKAAQATRARELQEVEVALGQDGESTTSDLRSGGPLDDWSLDDWEAVDQAVAEGDQDDHGGRDETQLGDKDSRYGDNDQDNHRQGSDEKDAEEDVDVAAEDDEDGTWESLEDLGLGPAAAQPHATVEEIPSEQLEQLEQLVELEATDLVNHRQLAEADRQQAELQTQAAQLQSQLRALGGELDWRRAPDEPQVDSLRQEHQQSAQRARISEQAQAEAQQALDALLREDQLQAAHAPPDRKQLHSLRLRRDEAWSLLRRRLLEADDAAEQRAQRQFGCDLAELAARYPSLVEAADKAADVRQEQADEVAQIESRRQAIQQQRGRLSAAERRMAEHRTASEGIRQRWRQLWPDGPEPAAEFITPWLRLRQQLVNNAAKQQLLAEQQAALQHEVQAYQRRLQAALQSDGDLESLRLELRQRLRSHHRGVARREQLALRLPELRAQLRDAHEDRQRSQSRLQQQELVWGDLRERLKLPDHWSPDQITTRLASLKAARGDWRRAAELLTEIDGMQAEAKAFSARVHRAAGADAAASSASSEEPAADAQQLLHAMAKRLELAWQAEQQLQAWQAEQQPADAQRQQLDDQLAAARQSWRQLQQASGAEDEQTALDGLRLWKEGSSLQQQLGAAQRELQAALRCDDQQQREQCLEVLARSSLEELNCRQQELRQKVDAQRLLLDNRLQEAGAVNQQLAELDDSDTAAAVDMTRQSCLTELSAAVDRWAPLMLAGAMMDRAVQRFEQEQQPALLADVTELFRRMTDGRYQDVRRLLDKEESLRVIDGVQQAKAPEQLSKGAREQLYLAIRLAYVRHYCRANEPLPLVIDDVLVNFDETRAKRTIEVLVEFSDQVQILMLTCHRTTARWVHEALPSMQPILLPGDSNETLEQWISVPRTRRTPTKRPPTAGQGVLFPKS